MGRKHLVRLVSSAAVAVGLGMAQLAAAAPAAAVPGLGTVAASSAVSSDVFRSQVVNCPAGKVVVGGGARINGGTSEVAITAFEPLPAGNGFIARAYEDADGFGGNWSLQVFAMCANPLPGWEIKTATSPVASPASASVTATCSPGRVVLGTGGSVSPGRGVVVLVGVVPLGQPANAVAAVGQETQGGFPGGWSVTSWAICANPVPGHNYFVASSVFDSASPKQAVAACPAGTFGHGVGVLISNGAGEVYLNTIMPNAVLPTNILGRAFEDQPPGYAGNWSIRTYAICAA